MKELTYISRIYKMIFFIFITMSRGTHSPPSANYHPQTSRKGSLITMKHEVKNFWELIFGGKGKVKIFKGNTGMFFHRAGEISR